MTDVFISYSRRDKAFTQRMVDTFKAANREFWADWEDIPPGSDWFAEIKQGIEEAQSVLFILSPEWLKSNECRKEMDYAVQMGKRLIPVVWQNVDPKEVPQELSKINWIFMREGDDFDKGFKLVLETMDTDLDWLKSHTRLQTRALEWDKKSKDNSFVLRGKDLEDAEQFLSHGSHKDPEPTELQGEYILISRKEAVRVQRMILTGVIAALVISVVLAIVAAFQWQAARRAEAVAVVERDNAVIAQNTAESAKATAVSAEGTAVAAKETAVAERDRADLNATIALARELAARSIQNLETDPELSILLALQAIDTTQRIKQPILPDAENALRRAVQTSRLRATLVGPADSTITSVAFSSDGKYMATAAFSDISVWELATLNNSGNPKPLAYFTDPAGAVDSMVFSPDGVHLITGDRSGAVTFWEFKTGAGVATVTGHTDMINSISIDRNGTRLATASDDGTVKIWNLAGDTLEESITISDHIAEAKARQRSSRVFGVALSPDGTLVVSGGDDGWVIFSDATTGARIYAYDNFSSVLDLSFSSDSNYLAWGDTGYVTSVMELKTLNVVFQKTVHTDQITGVSFSPDGSLVASSSFDDTVTVMNTKDGTLLYTLRGDNGDILSLAFSPDSHYIATGSPQGLTKLWDASRISGFEVASFQADTGTIRGIAYNPEGKFFAAAGVGGLAHLYPLDGGSEITLVGHDNDINDIAFSPDGKSVLTGSWDGQAILWNTSDGTQIRSFLNENYFGVLSVAFSPDGKSVAGGLNDGSVMIWDVQSGQVKNNFTVITGGWRIRNIAFSPDGSQLATVGEDSMLRTWNVATGERLLEFEQESDWIYAVAYSPDGKRLLTGNANRFITMWDAEKGTKLFTVTDFAASVNNVVFSKDGLLFATASSDGTAKIWDAETGNLLITLSAFAGSVNDLAFSPDRTLLVTGGDDGVVRVYFINVADVVALAQTRITRSLTAQECRIYLHQVPCPDTIIKPGVSMGIQVQVTPQPSTTTTAHAIRSGDGTLDVTLLITNNSSETLQLFWVDWDGIEQYYGDIAPGTTFTQPTFNTHAWRVRDASGNVIAEYIMTDAASQTIVINADKSVVLP